jgi:DNA-binding GntR family transcriptional regulator
MHNMSAPGDPLATTPPRTRAEAVATRLRKLIQSGDLAPGTRLRQAEVARQFDVSTTPVREAFVALAQEGLVRQDAHRGVVVFRPSVSELLEIYEIRGALESLATELAATRLDDTGLAAISAVVASMRDAEPQTYIELNRKLHSLIYVAAGRPRLIELIDALRDSASSYLTIGFACADQDERVRVQLEHEEIVAALATGTPDEAAQAIRSHLDRSAHYLAGLIQAQTPEEASAPA